MKDQDPAASGLNRLKWVAIVIPLAGIWLAEALRVAVLERYADEEVSHLLWSLALTVAVVLFGLVMVNLIDRTQRRIVRQNRDLGAIYTVSSEVRAGAGVEPTLIGALGGMVHATDALAGIARVEAPGLPPMVVRHPPQLPGGMAWLEPLLEERTPPPALPRLVEHKAVDAVILEVPLHGGGAPLGVIRLAFHPSIAPPISMEALADIGGEIGASIRIGHLVTDLQRRERERDALYQVALQLTGHTELREVLGLVSRHARELLSADRAVVCLSDPGLHRGPDDRLALADDGTTCIVSHPMRPGQHDQNPDCTLQKHGPSVAFASRPLRGATVGLGELCVARSSGDPFDPRELELLGALADMAAIAVRTAKLREAEHQMVILAERDRIAREMHDSLAQVLGVIHLQLRSLAGQPEADERVMSRQLDELADVADEAYRDVREAILGLRETVSADKGLEGTLRDYLGKYSRQTGITARLVFAMPLAAALPPRSEVQLLRVVQEALTNVRKHAGASTVSVRLDDDGHGPVLSIEDDGSGFDPARLAESMAGGFGLASMRERVEQIGGRLDVHTAPGEGTRIVVHLTSEEPRVASAPALPTAAGR